MWQAASCALTLSQLGSDGIQQQQFMKNFFRVLSLAMLPVTAGFPTVRAAPQSRACTLSHE